MLKRLGKGKDKDEIQDSLCHVIYFSVNKLMTYKYTLK